MVVEDEAAVAFVLEEMLLELGFKISFSLVRLHRAVEVASVEKIDIALLDVNLDGEPSYPVARLLRERGIPFVFTTGYGREGLSAEFAGSFVVSKPFTLEMLAKIVADALDAGAPRKESP